MILIGLGGNLVCETFGPPRRTCGAALSLLEARGSRVVARSRWYESAPVPAGDQPWYINAAVAIETTLDPRALVEEALEVEAVLGRRRSIPNAPRTIDLDVLAYGDTVIHPQKAGDAAVPHPRLHRRAFVLLPINDITPDWRHPESGTGIDALIDALPRDQICRPIDDADGVFGTEWRG